MHHVLPSPPAAVPAAPLTAHEAEEATAENVREDVVHTGSSSAPFSQALLPIAVVQLLLLGVS